MMRLLALTASTESAPLTFGEVWGQVVNSVSWFFDNLSPAFVWSVLDVCHWHTAPSDFAKRPPGPSAPLVVSLRSRLSPFAAHFSALLILCKSAADFPGKGFRVCPLCRILSKFLLLYQSGGEMASGLNKSFFRPFPPP